jgi:colanic acid/amylovoran biosynthesis protein
MVSLSGSLRGGTPEDFLLWDLGDPETKRWHGSCFTTPLHRVKRSNHLKNIRESQEFPSEEHCPRSQPPSVCLFGGSLDVSNMGCRALTSSVVNLLRQARPDTQIALLHGSRTRGTRTVRSASATTEVDVVNYRLSPRSKPSEHLFWILTLALVIRCFPVARIRASICRRVAWLDSLEKADIVVDICAGDSFSDIYGWKRYLLNLAPAVSAILLRKPLVLLPQTYGPFKSGVAERIARFVFEHSNRIYCRDRLSLEEVRRILGKKADYLSIKLCPDVAFSLAPLPPKEIQVIPPMPIDGCRVIGINVSGLLTMGGYTRGNMFGLKGSYPQTITNLIRRILLETDAHILLVPHGSVDCEEGDIRACQSLHSLLARESQGRLHLVTGTYDQHETKFLIGGCSFFIGSRLHACIGALSQGIPTIGIAYSRKFKGVFETVGLENLAVDATQLGQDEIVNLCMSHLEQEARIAAHLRGVLSGVRLELSQVFSTEILGPSIAA